MVARPGWCHLRHPNLTLVTPPHLRSPLGPRCFSSPMIRPTRGGHRLIRGAIADRSQHGSEVVPVLERCLALRNGPLSQCESIAALHFERPGGSPIKRSPSDPPPITEVVVRDDVFVADSNSNCGLHHFKYHPERCRRQGAGRDPVSGFF